MRQYNNLENPIFLFTLLLLAITLNIISSIYFLLILMCGVLFIAFYECLQSRRLYSLFFIVLTFTFIEINSGLKPLSLTLLSLFLYIFIVPSINRSITYSNINKYIYVILFYIGMLIIWSFSTDI
ncbi:MAG: hypothetical protein ACQERD_03575, partial [Campylobacterota bacterium]